jgi:hypothetical protein
MHEMIVQLVTTSIAGNNCQHRNEGPNDVFHGRIISLEDECSLASHIDSKFGTIQKIGKNRPPPRPRGNSPFQIPHSELRIPFTTFTLSTKAVTVLA